MNTYEIVTERIISLLEQGAIPWRRPWSSAGAPRNLVSKKQYRGVNFFLLSATKYASPFWLTLKQANEIGGSVRKGERSQIVVFWRVDETSNSMNESDPEMLEADEKNRRRFVLRYYRLWNMEQCDLPHGVLDKLPKIQTYQHETIEAAERIIANMPNPPDIEFAGTKAFYSPTADRITLPPRELFSSAEELYATLNHEESHAAGHPKRLNRKSIAEAAPFGSPAYGFEELIAEMSAAYLCAEAGISPAVIANEAAYIHGWLARLRSNERMVVTAAAQAQRAADYILNRSYTE